MPTASAVRLASGGAGRGPAKAPSAGLQDSPRARATTSAGRWPRGHRTGARRRRLRRPVDARRPPGTSGPGISFRGNEVEGDGVDAIASSLLARSCRVQVPQVRPAACAKDLALGAPAGVPLGAEAEAVGIHRPPEGGPPAPGGELGAGVEEILSAADTAVEAGVVVAPVLAAERRFGLALPGYPVLLERQPPLPVLAVDGGRLTPPRRYAGRWPWGAGRRSRPRGGWEPR